MNLDQDTRAQALVTRPVVYVHPNDTLRRVAETFVEESIGAALVRGPHGAIGLVSERDVVRDLERHTAAGRLSLDEYAERVDRVLASRTHGELAEVTADLPAAPGTAPTDSGQAHAGTARQLGIAFLIALAALVVVLALVALKG